MIKNPIFATKKEHLHHFFEDSVPVQKTKPGRNILSAVILVLIIISVTAGIYFIMVRIMTPLLVKHGKLTDSATNKNIGNTSVQLQPGTKNNNTSAPVRKDVPKPSVRNIPAASAGVSKGYTVITKAYFYSEPDTRKRKRLYLEPRKDLVLNPTNEQNGFVYAVYVNKRGQTTKGWLNKQDLQPVE